MIPLLIIRPEPGNSASLKTATALGLPVIGMPLMAIAGVATPAPTGPFDAVLAGSANAFRHDPARLAQWRHLPVHAVGEATAEAARTAGFAVASTGSGGLQALLDQLHRPAGALPLRLLRLAGQERVALTLPPGITMTEHVTYAAVPLPVPPALAAILREPAVVALHSAQAARHFASLTTTRRPLALACIGPRVAAAAGAGWSAVRSAATPDDEALLALAAEMCQTGR